MSHERTESKPFGILEDALTDNDILDILSDELEELYPVDFDGDEQIPDDASYLVLATHMVAYIEASDRDVDADYQLLYQNLYRSMSFSLALSRNILGTQTMIDISTTVEQLEQAEGGKYEWLLNAGQSYLDERPNLDALVHCFSGSISTSPEYDHAIGCMCGIWLKMVDEGYEIETLISALADQ